jgi:hypothetical protein
MADNIRPKMEDCENGSLCAISLAKEQSSCLKYKAVYSSVVRFHHEKNFPSDRETENFFTGGGINFLSP